MAFRLFITSLIFFISISSHAEITITNFKGFSRLAGPIRGDVTPTINTIYAGISGSENDCSAASKDLINTCSNCTASSAECNSSRIYDNLRLQITFQSSTTEGFILATTDGDEPEKLDPVTVDTTRYPANTSVTISIPWGEICKEVFGGTTTPNCDNATSDNENIRIGIDNDGDNELDDSIDVPIVLARLEAGTAPTPCDLDDSSPGLGCNFIVYPGDKKVFIDDIRTSCSFPTVSNSEANIRAVRVLYSEGGTVPTQDVGTFADFLVTDTSAACTATKTISTGKNEITGLENDTEYSFRMALVDEANNVGFFLNQSNTDIADNSDCFDPDQRNQSCHKAFPTQVVGLLEDEFDCFITTATYGSPFKPKVKVFREFRNQFLKRNLLGQVVIETYYAVSPPIARYIRNHPNTKSYVRYYLWPFWLFSRILTSFYNLFLVGLFSILALLIYRRRKA